MIDKFYDVYDEDLRLKTRIGRIEYITTLSVLSSKLEKGLNVLELGAGTGVYTKYILDRGCHLTTSDFLEKHVQILADKFGNDARVISLDACDLSEFSDSSFDIVIALGPLYHLCDKKRNQCIKEFKRVCKIKGSIFMSFILNDNVWISESITKKNKVNYDGNFNLIEEDNTVFYFTNHEDIIQLMSKHNLSVVGETGLDGISECIHKDIEQLDESVFLEYIRFHLQRCQQPSYRTMSHHYLVEARKL